MSGTVTLHLERLRAGEPGAREGLFASAYQELHRLARRQVARFRPDRTLGATALVHELYLKLGSSRRLQVTDRRHLFAVAARAMRQIAVDYARGRRRAKRGGPEAAIPLDRLEDGVGRCGSDADAVLAVERALSGLERLDPRLVRVVELRFFAGLSVTETAEALAVSTPTVKRDTRVARAFLQSHLGGSRREGAPGLRRSRDPSR